jgi:hypothetical protein
MRCDRGASRGAEARLAQQLILGSHSPQNVTSLGSKVRVFRAPAEPATGFRNYYYFNIIK